MVNKWQTFFLIILTLPIMGHVLLLPLVIDIAGRDAWISALLAFPVGVLFLIVIYGLRRLYLDKCSYTSFRTMLGSIFSIGIIILLGCYFIFLASITLGSMVDMVSTSFLPETPLWFLIISFLLLSIYGAAKNIKDIALIAGLLFFIVIISGHFLTFTNFPERELHDLLPVLEHGWTPVFWGTLLLSNVWIEFLFLLVISIKKPQEKRLLFIWFLGAAANVVMMFSTVTGVITSFGLGQAEDLVHPALEIIRIIDYDFIDRIDGYALVLMLLGSYIRVILFLRLSYDNVKALVSHDKKWVKWVIFSLLAFLIGILAYVMGETRMRVEYFLSVYAYSFVLYPLPFVMLVVAWLRKRKGYY